MKKATLLSLIWMLLSISAYAQKKPYLSDKDEIIALAKQTLDEGLEAEGFILKYVEKHELKGKYTFDITVFNKGEVSTVRAIDREGEVKMQNELKDFIKSIRFPMKLPKNQSYKFQYVFNLN